MPIFQLGPQLVFPPPSLSEPDGLLALGGDLEPERLLLAYRSGIFPWYSEGEPILWWSPDPRLVLIPDELHVSRRLARVLRQGRYRITADRDFAGVIQSCADNPRRGRQTTWITPRMSKAYRRLHELGYAHSVECWQGERLCGGLYGVALGRVFFGESMFSLTTDASKVALASLCRVLKSWGFQLIDCQVPSDHLLRLGAKPIPRKRFLRLLSAALGPAGRHDWQSGFLRTRIEGQNRKTKIFEKNRK